MTTHKNNNFKNKIRSAWPHWFWVWDTAMAFFFSDIFVVFILFLKLTVILHQTWKKTIKIAREKTHWHHYIGYSSWLAAREHLYTPSHRKDSTCIPQPCYISHGALAGMRNRSMDLPCRIDAKTHRTMSKRSTAELYLTPVQSYISLLYRAISHSCTELYLTPVQSYISLLYRAISHSCTELYLTPVQSYISLPAVPGVQITDLCTPDYNKQFKTVRNRYRIYS